MKKFLGFALALTLAVTLIGCTETTVPVTTTGIVDELGGVYDTVTTLAAGFTSLENQNANGPIDEDGYYEVEGMRFKTVDTFKTIYQTEPTKSLFNYLINTWTYNSEHYTNMIDGLVENDKYSNVVGAMAVGYKVVANDDGTETWTFQLRENVPWVNNDTGDVYAEVVAQDFVDGIKYVLDPINGSGTASIVYGVVKGAEAYYEALSDDEVTDLAFDTVGVVAVSKYQVAYTLKQPTPYFLSQLTYSPFLPVSQAWLDEKGTDFGHTVNDILVNGAFRITEHIKETRMEYTKNETYYDAVHVYVNHITKRFYPATSTVSTLREWFEAGYIDSFTVNTQDEVGYAQYVTGPDEEEPGTLSAPQNALCNGILATGTATYIGYFNFIRSTWEYTVGDDAKTQDQKDATELALRNVNFRKGFLYGINFMETLKWWNPDEPEQWLMRGYTIRELTAWEGKDYADYVNEVYNEEKGTTGVDLSGISQGSDPVYDAATATTYFNTAKAELITAGLTLADFPIQVDVIGNRNVLRQAFEQASFTALETNSNGVVDICYNIPQTADQNSQWGSVVNNYDFSLWSGWGPDYADPQTFLHTFAIDGDMVEQLGFDGTPATDALQTQILGAYDALYQVAAAITAVAQTDARYAAFAAAEYALIFEYAIVIPWLSQSGYRAVVAKTVPFQAGRASYGLTSDKLKNVIVTDFPITQGERAAVVAAYEAGR